MLNQLNETVKEIDRVKSVTVWPRKKTVFDKQVGGSWLLNLIRDPVYRKEVTGKDSLDEYDYILDMGGKSATVYDKAGVEKGKISYDKSDWEGVDNIGDEDDKRLLENCLEDTIDIVGYKPIGSRFMGLENGVSAGGKKKRTRKHKKSHKKTHKKTHKKSHKKSHKTHKKRHSKKNARKSRKHKSRK
jgi:hypothetical protein